MYDLCVVALVAFVVLGDAVRREVSFSNEDKASFADGVNRSTQGDKKECSRVKGADKRSDIKGFFATNNCECPPWTFVTGPSQACKDKNDKFQRSFSNWHFQDGGNCVCAPKAGCGMVRFPPTNVLPENAENADPKMIAPILVGNSDNIDTGIRELDEALYGIWWVTKPLLYDVAFSFAGASSPFKGKNMSSAEVDWKQGVHVRWPNLKQRRWSWMTSEFEDTPYLRSFALMQKLVLPLYLKPDGHRENSITFTSLTSGSVSTALKNMVFVWGKNWTIRQKNKDEWRVEILFSNGSFFSDHNTTVKRIIDGKSQTTSHWDEYKDKTSEIEKLVSFDSDSECKRRCMLQGNECHYCHDCCFGNKGKPRLWCIHAWKRPSWTMF